MGFYKSWQYLNNHIIFEDENNINHFQECLDICVVKVNPETDCISPNNEKNTKVNVWLECGPFMKNSRTHDIELDCGAKTFEKAIIKLAKKVKKVYGDDKKLAIKHVKEKYAQTRK